MSSLTAESPLPKGEMPRKAEFIFPPKRCEWPILSSLIIYEAFFEVPYISRSFQPLKKWLTLVTHCRQPFLKAQPAPRRRPNSSRRLRPGISPGNTERVPAQASPRAFARKAA